MKIKINEDLVSMFLGLLVVVAVVAIVMNFFQKRSGNVSVPGVSSELSLAGSESLDVEPERTLTEGGEREYVVTAGDSLWKIAVAQYGDGFRWTEISEENGITNPDFLAVGQVLKIKSVDKEMADYEVKAGDSLWKIAVAQYGDGFRWTEIWNLNRSQIVNPGMIEVGMVLRMVK